MPSVAADVLLRAVGLVRPVRAVVDPVADLSGVDERGGAGEIALALVEQVVDPEVAGAVLE